MSAREQIGLAMADKIRELKKGKEVENFVENVLPQVEKFLESPAERRLRVVRAGVITAAIGLGSTIVFFLMALAKPDLLFFVGPGFVAFVVGLGVIINGMFFTNPHKGLDDSADDSPSPNLLGASLQLRPVTSELTSGSRTPLGSITEHTTQHLGSKKT
jgi:hypothetical protein